MSQIFLRRETDKYIQQCLACLMSYVSRNEKQPLNKVFEGCVEVQTNLTSEHLNSDRGGDS